MKQQISNIENRQMAAETLEDLESWLEAGAFIGLPNNEVTLFWLSPLVTSQNSPNSQTSFVHTQDFFAGEQNTFLPSKVRSIGRHSFLQKLEVLSTEERAKKLENSEAWVPGSFESFQNDFQIIQRLIQREGLEKAVPITCWHQKKGVQRERKIAMLMNLFSRERAEQWTYGIWMNQSGAMGCSPEILFQVSEDQIQTMALAGTALVEPGQDLDRLLKDPKEMREHLFVVQDLVKRFEKLGPVRVKGPNVANYGTLAHLRTLIEAPITKQFSAMDWVRQLHPTPALGVYPREYGVRWMRELSGQNERGQFGAPILFSWPEQKICVALVAIRGVFWKATEARIWAGCGIVSESILEKEWQESQNKIRSVAKTFGFISE